MVQRHRAAAARKAYGTTGLTATINHATASSRTTTSANKTHQSRSHMTYEILLIRTGLLVLAILGLYFWMSFA
jgi:hypothetical protein